MAKRQAVASRPGWLAVVLALTACAGQPASPRADDPAIVPLFEQGLRHVVASGDPQAIGALAGAHPEIAGSIVAAAVTAHPGNAAGIAAAAAAEIPDIAPDLAAAAAMANPAAAPEIVRRTAVALPEQRAAIGKAVLDALLPDERLMLAAGIEAALDAAIPPSVDAWAGALSSRP